MKNERELENNNLNFQDNYEEIIEDKPKTLKDNRESNNKKNNKKYKKVGISLFVVGLITMMIFSTGKAVNDTPDAEEALKQHYSTKLPIGVKLSSKDDMSGFEKDYTITHKSSENETKIHIWDYAAEDGDYVKVLVNGEDISGEFMIKNKPVVFTVPTTCNIKVVGTRDGGGGITYAVHYDLNSTTYFNGMNKGNENIYTLIKE